MLYPCMDGVLGVLRHAGCMAPRPTDDNGQCSTVRSDRRQRCTPRIIALRTGQGRQREVKSSLPVVWTTIFMGESWPQDQRTHDSADVCSRHQS